MASETICTPRPAAAVLAGEAGTATGGTGGGAGAGEVGTTTGGARSKIISTYFKIGTLFQKRN